LPWFIEMRLLPNPAFNRTRREAASFSVSVCGGGPVNAGVRPHHPGAVPPTVLNPLPPPPVLDGAKVRAWQIQGCHTYTGRRIIILDGKVLGPVPCLAICQNDDEEAVLLFHCDDSWHVLGAACYRDVAAAIESAEAAYVGSSAGWTHVV